MEILDRLCELAYSHVSSYLIPTDRQLISSFLLLRADNSFDIVACPWANDKDKQNMIVELGLKILREPEPIQAYSFVSECWASHYQPGETKRADRPEHDPKKRETVICIASDGKEQKFRSWTIGRDRKGRCVSLSSDNPAGTYESWMIDAVDKALQLAEIKQKLTKHREDDGTRG